MTHWRETTEAAEFIASGDSRATSKEIMEAIAFFARGREEAEALWNGDGLGTICNPGDLWEHVTRNGLRDPAGYFWGAYGNQWWTKINDAEEGQ